MSAVQTDLALSLHGVSKNLHPGQLSPVGWFRGWDFNQTSYHCRKVPVERGVLLFCLKITETLEK